MNTRVTRKLIIPQEVKVVGKHEEPNASFLKVKMWLPVLRRVEPYGQSALLLAVRLLYGWFFVQTGLGKLTHLEATAEFFGGLGLPLPWLMAGFVGGTEMVGGILLATGTATRAAGAVLTTVMLTAYATAHVPAALESLSAFTEQEPFPFLLASLISLAFGAGMFSVDRLVHNLFRTASTGHVA